MHEPVQGIAKTLITGALDLLFPPKCALCGVEAPEPVCEDCRGKMALLGAPFCRKCGLPADGAVARCLQCRQYYTFDSARSAGWHEEGLREAIHLLKYQGRRGLAKPLARIMAESRAGQGISAEAIVPVPLHRSRLRSRGFNQSELLARELSVSYGIPVLPNALIRRRDTPPQVGRSAEERLESLRDAFEVRHPERVAGLNLLVIDDVFTTGSTASEVSRTLKLSGAGRITVFTLSRER